MCIIYEKMLWFSKQCSKNIKGYLSSSGLALRKNLFDGEKRRNAVPTIVGLFATFHGYEKDGYG